MLSGLENALISELTSKLILDTVFSKLVYYKNEKGDILALDELEQPFLDLENQIFKNRRPPKILTEQDVCVFVYLDDTRNFSVKSRKIKTVWIKVGFLVHENCSVTNIGIRESAMISRIQYIAEKTDFKSAIGKCKCEKPVKLNGLPTQWNGYEIPIKMDGWFSYVRG